MSRSRKKTPVTKIDNSRCSKRLASKQSRMINDDDVPIGNRSRYKRMNVDKWDICDWKCINTRGPSSDNKDDIISYNKKYVWK